MDVEIDFLQAGEIGFLAGDHVEDAIEMIAAVAAADAFMDVVTYQ